MDVLSDKRLIFVGIGVVALFFIGGYLINKNNTGTAAANGSTGTGSDLSGLSNGVVYVPTQTSYSTTTKNSNNTTSGASGTSTGGTHATKSSPTVIASQISQAFVPAPVSASKNSYTYTTLPGETLNSLATKFKWANQAGGGAAYVYDYQNNAGIFNSVGISPATPNAAIPAGLRISA